ncbi:unnamed protein product [Mytilus edulis]|uniref:DDE-1 domain-containing protein n=1 Tax=Mytilus edulis TaxID=6550 RepID=A0A8S3V628_MYTED|nr:unnamed protein product [Mytilus edulis]
MGTIIRSRQDYYEEDIDNIDFFKQAEEKEEINENQQQSECYRNKKKKKKKWLKSGSIKVKAPATPGLPDPSQCSTQPDVLVTQAAKDGIDTMKSATSLPTTPTRKRKRGDYNYYDDETRAKIARYSVENGVARAARKFSSDLSKKDQTGCQLIPGGDWTMEQQGSQQVPITGIDDKRQITLLLATSMNGSLLPPQLIYQGKTDRSLPKGVDFPDNWDVTSTETHWSNEDTMIRFVDKVILPYVEGIIEDLPLSQKNQKAVAIFDVYRAHTGEKLLSHLKKNDIIPLFVPAACTDKLQPLIRYSAQVVHQLNHQEDITGEHAPKVIVDLKTSVMKPIHAQWVVSTHQIISTRTDLIKSGFRKAGLL